MRKNQRTIREAFEAEGTGLFTGNNVHVRFLPAPPGTGIVFIRADLPNRPRVKVSPETLASRFRRTAVASGPAEVESVEHVLSALGGVGIDNLEVEVNAPEMPGLDGSSRPYVDLVRRSGVLEQEEERPVLRITEPISVVENDVSIVALPSDRGLTVSYTLNYDGTPVGAQHLVLEVNESTYAEQIAPARTFCLEAEVQAFLAQGLGKGASYENTLVVGRDGVISNQLRFADEFVRHKILDLLGDLNGLNAGLQAHIVAIKSGHSTNVKFVKKVWGQLQTEMNGRAGRQPALDVSELLSILPHRYPMLLIDRVIELDGYTRAVGLKNVTINEPYFQGHFPGRPIMPGVLVVEAMAQLAGALLMRRADNQAKIAVLLSLDAVKLRKSVVPGDQLRIEAETLKIKARTAEVQTRVLVNGQVAAEANMKFMLADRE